MVEVFREQYGKEPKIEAIHAGLECGVFAGKLPGLDCVSIGPDLFEIHTPRERLSISSVQRIWDFVVEVLKRSKCCTAAPETTQNKMTGRGAHPRSPACFLFDIQLSAFSRTTATSLTFVPVGPVWISPPTFSRAW